MMTRRSGIVSVARGIVISGALIMLLPHIAGPDSIWWAMPLTETIVFIYALGGFTRPAVTAK